MFPHVPVAHGIRAAENFLCIVCLDMTAENWFRKILKNTNFSWAFWEACSIPGWPIFRHCSRAGSGMAGWVASSVWPWSFESLSHRQRSTQLVVVVPPNDRIRCGDMLMRGWIARIVSPQFHRQFWSPVFDRPNRNPVRSLTSWVFAAGNAIAAGRCPHGVEKWQWCVQMCNLD